MAGGLKRSLLQVSSAGLVFFGRCPGLHKIHLRVFEARYGFLIQYAITSPAGSSLLPAPGTPSLEVQKMRCALESPGLVRLFSASQRIEIAWPARRDILTLVVGRMVSPVAFVKTVLWVLVNLRPVERGNRVRI